MQRLRSRDTAAMLRQIFRAAVLIATIAIQATNTTAQMKEEPAPAKDAAPPLPADVLKDGKVIAQGEKLWQEQCTHCHGAKSYPGKAPRLQPRQYKPEFVWDRTHNGFRGMPPWRDVYKPDEIIALVAYVLSDDFFP